MRPVAFAIMIFGICLLALALLDEHRGETVMRRRYTSYTIKRGENPERFRDAMHYKWGRGAVWVCCGWIILGICRRADRSDPFSPDFAGNDALDELHKSLDREEERRKRPLE